MAEIENPCSCCTGAHLEDQADPASNSKRSFGDVALSKTRKEQQAKGSHPFTAVQAPVTPNSLTIK
jgi:hypothetical protein